MPTEYLWAISRTCFCKHFSLHIPSILVHQMVGWSIPEWLSRARFFRSKGSSLTSHSFYAAILLLRMSFVDQSSAEGRAMEFYGLLAVRGPDTWPREDMVDRAIKYGVLLEQMGLLVATSTLLSRWNRRLRSIAHRSSGKGPMSALLSMAENRQVQEVKDGERPCHHPIWRRGR